jgi:hypothetical protein
MDLAGESYLNVALAQPEIRQLSGLALVRTQ